MKIKSLKINHFGNLKEKEIHFGDHINIVQGSNESGKSTLLKFISNIFYGSSKNKKGKEFSDYDKYKPWGQEEFSGKLTYTLDDGTQYEVFRDFNKKNPVIYNEQLEDISKQFTIDKTYGNQFFVEQTKVEESIFYSTLVSMQQEVKLEQNTQNAMVQKVANLAGTGDDSVSYKKAIEKINKKQVEEIGTARSQGRPMNIIKEEKFNLQDEIGTLEEYKQRKQEIASQKEEIQKELSKIEKTLEIIKKVKAIKEGQKLEEEKIKISENVKQSQQQKKEELEKQQKELAKQIAPNEKEELPQEKSKKKGVCIIFFIISMVLEIISIVLIKNGVVIGIFAVAIILSAIWYIEQISKQKQSKRRKEQEIQKQQKQKMEIKEQLDAIEAQIKLLQNNIEEQEKEIKSKKEHIALYEEKEKQKLQESENQIELVENLFATSNIEWELEQRQEEQNHKKLAYHSLELEENTMAPKLEKIALLEEQLEELNQKEEELEKNNIAIELAKEILETAYQKMKQNVTPKLTQKLSQTMEKLSNEKYKKVSLSEENGLMVEKENGEYIEAEKLSIRNH